MTNFPYEQLAKNNLPSFRARGEINEQAVQNLLFTSLSTHATSGDLRMAWASATARVKASARLDDSGEAEHGLHCKHGEAARQDARNRASLQAAAFAVNLMREANRKGGKRAVAAQQPHTLLVAVAPRLQRRQFNQTRRQLECQLRRLLQVMRARGSASEVGASGCRVQHKQKVLPSCKTGEESLRLLWSGA